MNQNHGLSIGLVQEIHLEGKSINGSILQGFQCVEKAGGFPCSIVYAYFYFPPCSRSASWCSGCMASWSPPHLERTLQGRRIRSPSRKLTSFGASSTAGLARSPRHTSRLRPPRFALLLPRRRPESTRTDASLR